jgi:thiol-disulfide isomerase/thioredoxin
MRSKKRRILKRISIPLLLLLILPAAGRGQELATTASPNAANVTTCTLFVFTGSDWCMNCKRLEKKVLGEPAFAESMKKNGIEIRIIDFPQRKKLDPAVLKYNQSIADNYHFEGVYPTLVLAKSDSRLYRLFFYRNQGWDEFSGIILEHKAKMNE